MRIKENDQLTYIALCAKRQIADVANCIVGGLLGSGIMTDEKDNYGCCLRECIEEDTPVMTVVEILKGATGLDVITCDVFDAFFDCVVMGDGDCPICGGRMELVDSEYYTESNCDPYSKPETVVTWEKFQCCVCDHIITHDYNKD